MLIVLAHQVWASTKRGPLRIYSATTCEVVQEVELPTNTYVWSLVTVKGKYVWAGTEIGHIRIYNAKSKYESHTRLHHAVARSSSTTRTRVRVWLDAGNCGRTWLWTPTVAAFTRS